MDAKNTNLLASEDIIVLTAPLTSSKGIFGMRISTDSHWAPSIGWQFTSPSVDAVKSDGGEDNFGFYRAVNPVHRCVSNDDSTTQWWFGEHC